MGDPYGNFDLGMDLGYDSNEAVQSQEYEDDSSGLQPFEDNSQALSKIEPYDSQFQMLTEVPQPETPSEHYFVPQPLVPIPFEKFSEACYTNKHLLKKISVISKIIEQKRKQIEDLEKTRDEKRSELEKGEQNLEDSKKRQFIRNDEVDTFKVRIKELEDRRGKCDGGFLLRQEKYDTNVLNDKLRQAINRNAQVEKRMKELNFQNERLQKDIDKLEVTSIQRNRQLDTLRDRLIHVRSLRNNQFLSIESKERQLWDLEKRRTYTKSTASSYESRLESQYQEVCRQISERDNELEMINEMLKTWSAHTRQKKRQVYVLSKSMQFPLPPVKLSRSTRYSRNRSMAGTTFTYRTSAGKGSLNSSVDVGYIRHRRMT